MWNICLSVYFYNLWVSISLSLFLLNDSFLKLIWPKKILTQIFIYFSKPLRLLYSLIVYEIVNFLSLLFTLCYFFLSFYICKWCSIHVIVHVYMYMYIHSITSCTCICLFSIVPQALPSPPCRILLNGY